MPGNAGHRHDVERYKGHVNPQALHALEVAFGVNTHQSLLSAYFTYLGNIFTGHFGISLTFFPDTVMHQVLQALPWTLALVGTTTILAFVLGTVIGLVSAWRRGGALDGAPTADLRHHLRVPVLLARAARDLALRDQARLAPGERRLRRDDDGRRGTWAFVLDAFTHSILPALTILVTSIGGWILTMRNNTITVLAEDYVRMARAKGLKPVADHVDVRRTQRDPAEPGRVRDVARLRGRRRDPRRVRLQLPGRRLDVPPVGREPGLRAHAGALPA